MNQPCLMLDARIRLAAILSILATLTSSPASASDLVDSLLSKAFRIYDSESSGTCFIIQDPAAPDDPRHVAVVTAAHVLESMASPQAHIVLRRKDTDGSFARLEVDTPIREGAKPLWIKHKDQDIAALRVQLTSDADVQPFRLDQLADESALRSQRTRVGQEAWIPCFPVRLESSPSGWPILRSGTIATHPLFPVKDTPTILIDYSTFGGDSGAPVVVYPQAVNTEDPPPALLIGLVVGHQRQTDKATLPFEEHTVHTPLGLAIVVQAAFIRETVERLPKEGPTRPAHDSALRPVTPK